MSLMAVVRVVESLEMVVVCLGPVEKVEEEEKVIEERVVVL
jgi:hypothetical protein